MFTALSAMLLLAAGIIPAGSYAVPLAAGAVLMVLSWCAGSGCAAAAYAAVSLIGLLFCADKEAAMCFIFLFGYYPLVKKPLDSIKSRILSYFMKLAVFNAAAAGVFFVLKLVFLIPDNAFDIFGISLPLVTLMSFNIFFLIYDTALGVFERRYKGKVYKLVTKIWR